MDGWVGGWMDRWMDGWVDGWMNGWVDGWVIDGLMDECVSVDRHELIGINALLWWRGPHSGRRAHCSWGPGASWEQGLKGPTV